MKNVYLQIGWLLLLATSFSYADTNEWELRRDSDGIKVYQQPTKSGYAITRGVMRMTTSLDTLLTLMSDRSTCQYWIHACKKGQLIQQYNTEERLDYTVIDSPLWFADRDSYIHSITHFNHQAKTVFIQLSGREKHDEGQSGRVRIKNIQGFWQLQQDTPEEVAAVYQMYANPQLMASALLDAYMVESVFSTLTNLNKLAQEARNRNRRVPELQQKNNNR